MILIIGVTRTSVYSLTSKFDIGSRSHDLVREEFRILRMSSLDTGSKENRVLLLFLSLVAGTGINDSRETLNFIILYFRYWLNQSD